MVSPWILRADVDDCWMPLGALSPAVAFGLRALGARAVRGNDVM